MAKSKYKVKAMDELPSEEQLAQEEMERAALKKATDYSEQATEVVDKSTSETSSEEAPATSHQSPVAKPVGFRSVRYKAAKSRIDRTKSYTIEDALSLLKDAATAKFDETVEVHLVSKDSLGTVEVAYPHSIGKTVRVAVFSDEIAANLDKGIVEFDMLVASPAQMKNLTKYARLLGPKGLMPNPKNGTLVADPEKRAVELSSGKTSVRSEKKAPLMHTTVGKISLGTQKLAENIRALISACGQSKVLKAVICTSMSPAVRIQL